MGKLKTQIVDRVANQTFKTHGKRSMLPLQGNELVHQSDFIYGHPAEFVHKHAFNRGILNTILFGILGNLHEHGHIDKSMLGITGNRMQLYKGTRKWPALHSAYGMITYGDESLFNHLSKDPKLDSLTKYIAFLFAYTTQVPECSRPQWEEHGLNGQKINLTLDKSTENYVCSNLKEIFSDKQIDIEESMKKVQKCQREAAWRAVQHFCGHGGDTNVAMHYGLGMDDAISKWSPDQLIKYTKGFLPLRDPLI